MILTFSQNFSSNGPYVVLNFCKFSDTGSPPLTQFSNNTVLGQIFVKFGEFLSILSIKSKYVVIWAISFQKKTGWSLIYQLLLGPWSLLPEGLLLLVLIFSKVYYLVLIHMGGPYEMIMRVHNYLHRYVQSYKTSK